MFPFMLFSTLFSSTFTDPGEQRWVCNSSDASVWYSYCDNINYHIAVNVTPCITLKRSSGYLHIFYIPRRNIENLYFNLYLSLYSMKYPIRTEIICQGADDIYSFCGAQKGETVHTKVRFSFTGVQFSKGRYKLLAEAISGSTEDRLFCLNFTVIHRPNSN
ncbi:lymphocyte antigen 96 [Talpa occidentalis]|uniref:lymphocyte antigen 96 n=1 Tax=Talpa occidentalis TaxID=50954 RepID=UPI0018908DA1|nr:lymphocyte antigen 96 [Talpa occidentalis]